MVNHNMNSSSTSSAHTSAAAAVFVVGVAITIQEATAAGRGTNEDARIGGHTSFPQRNLLGLRRKLLVDNKPLDWDDELVLTEKQLFDHMTITNLLRTSASISIIASALLIAHILRSHLRLSTTYHRLVLGLSIPDVLFSSTFVLGPLMVPKEMKYEIPGALGTVGTCTAQGFIYMVTLGMSTYYKNCSICCYYLAIIKYNKSDAYIAKKLEGWLHGIPITVSLFTGLVFMAGKYFNPWGTFCFQAPYNPPHCNGYDDGVTVEEKGFSIPCGTVRGFFHLFGSFMSVYYNCSICCYYLAIINYNKSDAYITKKLEGWLHGIPIAVSLFTGFVVVAEKGFNTFGKVCFLSDYEIEKPLQGIENDADNSSLKF